MELQEVSNLATLFVLLVDPKNVKKKEDFRMVKKNDYKYFLIGGNHSTYAKMDLAKANLDYVPYWRVLAWIFVGLSVSNARQLA
jgi:hypothetical protein